jgi:hypothetical protein
LIWNVIGVVVPAKIGKGSTVVMVSGPVATLRVKLCVASAPTPLCAVNVSGKLPVVLVIPLSTPVELLNVTPLGGTVVALRLRVGAGKPEAVTVNIPHAPEVKVVLSGLVNEGASFTVSVKFCVAFVPAPLLAVIVMG